MFFEAVDEGRDRADRKSVVVVDEMSLLGTRQGLDLLRLQDEHGFRLVMIGDDKQCQSIEAGPIIELARRRWARSRCRKSSPPSARRASGSRKSSACSATARPASQALAMKREDGTAELVPGGYREAARAHGGAGGSGCGQCR